MSEMLLQFEEECRAAAVKPQDALTQGGLHALSWYRWISGKTSPSLNNFEAARRGLREIVEARQTT